MPKVEEMEGYRIIFCFKYGCGFSITDVQEKLNEIDEWRAAFRRTSGGKWYHKKYFSFVKWYGKEDIDTITAIVQPDLDEDKNDVIRASGSLIEWLFRYDNDKNLISVSIDRIKIPIDA
jgi:uncharacterized beta-barrel protein YwiB (DUF1934 family)